MENNNQQITDLFNSLFSTEDEQEEASEYLFEDESDIDSSIEAVQELNEDQKRFEDMYEDKLSKIKCEFDARILKISNKRDWILFNLKNSVLNSSDSKESKTQFKKSYLAGDVVVKKESVKLIKPDLSIEDLTAFFPEYKKEDIKVSLDWAELKKDLCVIDNAVIQKSTGLDLSHVVSTETIPEKVIIK